MDKQYWDAFYSGILPSSPGIRPSWTLPASANFSPYMTASERAQLEQQMAASKALQSGDTGQAPTAVAGVPLPRPRPWEAPTSMDVASAYAPAAPVNPAVAAATGATNPVTNVTGQMKPAQSGGLLDLLFGPSKNGMSGLLGLLGGPQAGGLLGMLSQGQGQGAAPAAAPPEAKRTYNADLNTWIDPTGVRSGFTAPRLESAAGSVSEINTLPQYGSYREAKAAKLARLGR
jgi:hypothetical protein